MPHFWRHAVSVGLLAGALSNRVPGGVRDRFFVAGLVHDMGRLLLAIAEPELAALVQGRIQWWDTPWLGFALVLAILGLGGRTVNKHLEQVFLKMGVENRTAAAVLADRAMNGN